MCKKYSESQSGYTKLILPVLPPAGLSGFSALALCLLVYLCICALSRFDIRNIKRLRLVSKMVKVSNVMCVPVHSNHVCLC